MTDIDWHGRWNRGEIGFHLPEVNPRLAAHLDRFSTSGDRVLVPLCGKARDLHYFSRHGRRVIGVELVEKAVNDFYEEAQLTPSIERRGALSFWRTADADIIVSDYLAVSAAEVGVVDAIWDRAALIALPPDVRRAYATHTARLARPGARILLVTLAYDQALMDGPPFSVSDDEVERIYRPYFDIARIERSDADPPRRLRDVMTRVTESVYLGTRNDVDVDVVTE